MTIGVTGAAGAATYNAPAAIPTTSTVPTEASSTGASGSSGITSQLSTPNLFIKLLMAELQHENPTNPTTPSTILQQTAELSQVEAVTTMTATLKSEQHYAQDTEATGILGKKVTATIAGVSFSGVVSDVALSPTGTPVLVATGVKIPLSSVTGIAAP